MRFYLEYRQWLARENGVVADWGVHHQALVSKGLEGAKQEAQEVKGQLLKTLPPAVGPDGGFYPRGFSLVGKEEVE